MRVHRIKNIFSHIFHHSAKKQNNEDQENQPNVKETDIKTDPKNKFRGWVFESFDEKVRESPDLPASILKKVYNSLVGPFKVDRLTNTQQKSFPHSISVIGVIDILDIADYGCLNAEKPLKRAVKSIEKQIETVLKSQGPEGHRGISMNLNTTCMVLKFFTSGSMVDHDVEEVVTPSLNAAPKTLDNVKKAQKTLIPNSLPPETEIIEDNKCCVNKVENIQSKPVFASLLHGMACYQSERHKTIVTHACQPIYNSRPSTSLRISKPLELVCTSARGKTTTLADHYVTYPCMALEPDFHYTQQFEDIKSEPNEVRKSVQLACTDRISCPSKEMHCIPIQAKEVNAEVDQLFHFASGKFPEEYFKQVHSTNPDPEEEEENEISHVDRVLKNAGLEKHDRNPALVALALGHLSAKYEGLGTIHQWKRLKEHLADRLQKTLMISNEAVNIICHGETC